MKNKTPSFTRKFSHGLSAILAWTVIAALTPASAQTTFKVIDDLDGSDGAFPSSGLVVDASGNVYGTASGGGIFTAICVYTGGCGTVFKLSPTSSGRWETTTLYKFKGGKNDGFEPEGGLIADKFGNLYGTTYQGGLYGFGTVFELSPSSDNEWTETLLHSFDEAAEDAGAPQAGLVFDTAGNLYGSASDGGAYFHGAVFELSPASNGTWSETVLYSFTGKSDGWNPETSLTRDAAGNLFGTTAGGGDFIASSCPNGCGVVFELSPNASGGWTETVLHAFNFQDGENPAGNLVFDGAGNLYGTTFWGGNTSACDVGSTVGCGSVYELSPSVTGWNETATYLFNRDDGNSPSGLAFDAAGKLYGTAFSGGAGLGGIVFTLSPNSNGGWTQKVIHSFSGGSGGGGPIGMTFDSAGNLFSTGYGGNLTSCASFALVGCGLVFEIKP